MLPQNDRVRAVWRELSRDPQLPIRELARRTGYGTTTIDQALDTLERLGYITRERGRPNTRAVQVFYGEV